MSRQVLRENLSVVVNRWFFHCSTCNVLTEFHELHDGFECQACGCFRPKRFDVKAKQRAYFQRADVKAKQRAYFQRADVKAKKRAYFQRADVKAKQRAYFQRADVKAKKRAYLKAWRQRQLEAVLE